MANKQVNDVLKLPVDVIDNGTRKRWDTRQEAIDCYLEAMIASEGSAKERYSNIYIELKYGKSDVVSDGEPEIVQDVKSMLIFKDKDTLIKLIENKELSINSSEIYDVGTCKLIVEDKDVIKALLMQDGWYAAQFLRKYIENDKDLILAVALGGEEPGRALAYASDELRDDKNFVIELLKIDATDFQYVSERLSNDIDVVAVAMDSIKSDFDFECVLKGLGRELLTEMVEILKQHSKSREAQGLDGVISSANKIKAENESKSTVAFERDDR